MISWFKVWPRAGNTAECNQRINRQRGLYLTTAWECYLQSPLRNKIILNNVQLTIRHFRTLTSSIVSINPLKTITFQVFNPLSSPFKKTTPRATSSPSSNHPSHWIILTSYRLSYWSMTTHWPLCFPHLWSTIMGCSQLTRRCGCHPSQIRRLKRIWSPIICLNSHMRHLALGGISKTSRYCWINLRKSRIMESN